MNRLNKKENQILAKQDHRLTFPTCHGVGCSCGGFLFGYFILRVIDYA